MRPCIPFLTCLGFVAYAIDGVFWDIHNQQAQRVEKKKTAEVFRDATKSVYRGSVTWYGLKKPSGKPYDGSPMNGGGVFRQTNAAIVAVPVRGKTKGGRYLPILPYGTRLRITIPSGKSIEVIVSDTCPGGTWDLSAAGMKALGFKNPNQKIRNARIEVMK